MRISDILLQRKNGNYCRSIKHLVGAVRVLAITVIAVALVVAEAR